MAGKTLFKKQQKKKHVPPHCPPFIPPPCISFVVPYSPSRQLDQTFPETTHPFRVCVCVCVCPLSFKD